MDAGIIFLGLNVKFANWEDINPFSKRRLNITWASL